jgi:RHS repeat-associated protein
VRTLTAVNPATGDQTTTYLYGVTLANSAIARNDLLAAVLYLDAADSTDSVQNQYNLQSEVWQMQDQNGSVHQYFRDLLGRVVSDQVQVLGTGVDGAVQRIDTAYEIRGMISQVTSYTLPTSGAIVNQVTSTFNDFEQVATEAQQLTGSGPTYTVNYSYAEATASFPNMIAPTLITYPYSTGTREVGFNYNSGDDLSLGRVSSLSFAGINPLVSYAYFGVGGNASVTYNGPGVSSTLATSAPSYPGYDPFDRVIDLPWTKTTSGDLAQLAYGYNQASSRTYRADVKAESASVWLDELYGYDGLQRLLASNRGKLTESNTVITEPALQQSWKLDATGNWQDFTQFDLSASSPLAAVAQERTSNAANEIVNIATQVGAVWLPPGYDRNGNMTTIPQPGNPAATYPGVFDAWNRLVALTGTATFGYDGLHRRTILTPTGGPARYFVNSSQWQVLEEYLSTNTAVPDRQYVWGIRYIDDLVLRDRNITGGTLERRYALQDANWNVVAICDTSGAVQERYAYTAYGVCQFLDSGFAPLTGGAFDWTVLYTGRALDDVSGLYYYRMRYYQPSMVVFVSRDLVATTASLYSYCNGAPVSLLDPSGQYTFLGCCGSNSQAASMQPLHVAHPYHINASVLLQRGRR